MAATSEVSITTEVIKEVQSYLPDMDGYLRLLARDISSHSEEGERELHRMTHTIKGAAAMVQLAELSETAALMEDVLDEILAGDRAWSETCIGAVLTILENIATYCAALGTGDADAATLIGSATRAFEEIKNESATALSPALDTDLEDDPAELLALLTEDGGDAPEDDFFQQFIEESGEESTANELESFLAEPDDTAQEDALDALLGIENSSSLESDTESVLSEETFAGTALSIDQELQESFEEEAEEHLDNISRQLNELSSAVSEEMALSERFRRRLHSVRRSVHTLKGAAAVIGIESVAAWGHDFEDFLDCLHDESETISPEGIAAMQDGADILERIATDPAADISAARDTLLAIFPSIVVGTAENQEAALFTAEPVVPAPAAVEEWKYSAGTDISRQHIFQSRTDDPVADVAPVRIAASKKGSSKGRKRTVRVGNEKISAIMGLGGDMAITLSSFENSASSMQSRLEEFEGSLQRLKTIVADFEAGCEKDALLSPASLQAVAGEQEGRADEFDSLELDRYSELHILSHSLNEVVADFESFKSQSSTAQEAWQLAVDRQRRVVGELQSAVQSIQMTPFSTLGNRLYKTVRESARVTDKKVRLLIEGGSIEMDTYIWNVLADALMHMLRNCVDHGVETAEERKMLGKAEQATIRINCSRKGSRFVLRLSDDGGGLNHEAIRERALMLYPGSGVREMDNSELAALIFKPGFSVRSQATSISGRGVGMDVVRNALDQLNGFIDVYSRSGEGTDFVLSMPIVVAQLPALMVIFGGQQFAVPMRDVNSVLRISAREMRKDTFEVNGEAVPLLRPASLMRLHASGNTDTERSGFANSSLALAVEASGRRGLLVADAILGQKEVVFKGLSSHLRNIPCVAGATIMGDGSLLPILQTEDLFTLAEAGGATVSDAAHEELQGSVKKVIEILVVDDSLSVRKVLNNFITGQGWRAREARDGVEAVNSIREELPDLIILDIEMPRMNGFEVLQSLQSQSGYRDIPVLMLTSRSAEKYKEKAARLGARGFVSKPFQDDTLISLINTLLPGTQTGGTG